MATTSPPKSNDTSPQNSSRKLLGAFVIWIVLSLGLLAAVYAQSAENSLQIKYLTSEIKKREMAQYELRTYIDTTEMKARKELQQNEQVTTRRLNQMQTDLDNYQEAMERSTAKQEEISSHLNLLSERLDKKENELNGQEDFQSMKKQVEQMKDSFHSYIKSQDFFQVVNDMMDMYSKKFSQIYQELDEKNEIIRKLLEASQNTEGHPDKESMMKREELHVKNVVSEENTQIPEISSHEEESFIHQVEADIEDLKEKISNSVEETLGKMKDFTVSAKEKLEPVKDLIVNNAEDSMNKMKELAQNTREKLKELIGNEKESPLEKVKEFAKSTGENLGAIKDFVVTNAGQSAEKIKEISKTAKERIGPIKEAVSEQAHQVKESVQKIGKNLEEKTKEIAEKAKNFAKKFF